MLFQNILAYESNSQTEVVPIQGFQTVQADVSNSFNTDETYNEIEDNIGVYTRFMH